MCESVIRSESVWNVHINSKQHKQNIALAKRKKDLDSVQNDHPASVKRKLEPTIEEPPKKVKSMNYFAQILLFIHWLDYGKRLTVF